MADNKFKVRYGLTVGDGDRATINGNTGDIATDGNLDVTGDAFVNANLTVNGTATLGNAVGDTVTINGDAVINNALTIGSSSGDTVTVNSQVAGNIAFSNNGTTTSRGVSGTVGTNDYWRFGGAAAGENSGYAEIATGDDGTEPIYVRQYAGVSPARTATLLDGSGNTQFPGDLTISGGELTIASPGYIYSDTGLAIQVTGNNAIVQGELTVAGNVIKSSTDTVMNFNGNDVAIAGDLRVSGDVIRKSGGAEVISFSGTNLTTLAGDLTVGGNTIRSSGNTAALELSGADVTAQGNLTVTGDLTVNGTTTTINTQNLLVEDNIVTLNSNVTGTPASNAGIEIERGDLTNTQLLWNESTDRWTSTVDGTVYLNLPNQNLDITSDVLLNSVRVTDSFAAGGAAVGGSGEIGAPAAFDATGAATGATMQLGLRSENVTTGFATTTGIIDHGQNRPGGTATTSGNPNIYLESTRGTAAAPTATGSGDTIGSLNLGGHDGVRGLGSQVNGGSVQLIAVAGQAFLNSAGFTTQAGATTILRSQPHNLRLTSASRQNILLATYTGGTANTPPTQNLIFNSSTMSVQYDTAGNSINGHGRQDLLLYHPTLSLLGVPAESTANTDNTTLPGSNQINFYSNRQSAWVGRRDLVEAADTLAQIRVFGQTTNNSSGLGSQAGTIEFKAAETFSTTRRGSQFKIQTGEIGTNTLSDRLTLDSVSGAVSTVKTSQRAPGGNTTYGGEISQKVGIRNGAGGYDRATEISVTSITTDGTSSATYETKTNRYDGTNYAATVSGDILGRFTFLGNYGTSTTPLSVNAAGSIQVRAAENFTATASGTSVSLSVNKIGTNSGVNALSLSSTQSTYQSDAFKFRNSDTSTEYLDINNTRAKFSRPVEFPVYTVATKPATGSIGQQIAISDSAQGSNPNGMMAFWDTTNTRWSYIHDNSAV